MSADPRLDGVHPGLIAAVDQILTVMAILGHPMIVTNGVRTDSEQQRLYAQGRTTPGAIVTHADGVVKKSHHQPKADGYGHAVDCCFLLHGRSSWAESHPWRLYGEVAKALGCRWGGDWTPFIDRPHIEWPDSV